MAEGRFFVLLLRYLSIYTMEKQLPHVPVDEYRGFRYSSNFAGKILRMVIDRNHLFAPSLPPNLRADLDFMRKKTVFSYVDTYYNVVPPVVQQNERLIEVISRKVTNQYSDKLRLGRLVRDSGITDCCPATYESAQEALEGTKYSPSGVVYLKDRFGTRGQQVKCVRREDLYDYYLPDRWIIQEGVQNISLYDDVKIVFRCYVIVVNKEVWVSNRFFGITHEVKYDPEAADLLMQVQHAHYAEPDSKIQLIPGHYLASYDRIIFELDRLLSRAYPIFGPLIETSNEDRFALLGLDILQTWDGSLRFIEINSFPSFGHPDNVVDEVNIPMFQWLFLKMFVGINLGTCFRVHPPNLRVGAT